MGIGEDLEGRGEFWGKEVMVLGERGEMMGKGARFGGKESFEGRGVRNLVERREMWWN